MTTLVMILRPRPAAALALVLSVLALPSLAACGGDDDGSAAPETSDTASAEADDDAGDEPTSPQDESSTAPDTGDDPPIPLIPGDPCDVEVLITGAVEADWNVGGVVLLVDGDNGPPATYQTADGQNVVTVYAEGNGFEASAVLTAGTTTYGTSTDADGVEVAPDGSGATVDADLASPDGGDEARLTATFTC